METWVLFLILLSVGAAIFFSILTLLFRFLSKDLAELTDREDNNLN